MCIRDRISLAGVRFEIPARYRHFLEVTIRYARWDLGQVDLVDPRDGTVLASIYPLDKSANADARRAILDPEKHDTPADTQTDVHQPGDKLLPPLLAKILKEYSATGMPPAYLPKKPDPKKGKES